MLCNDLHYYASLYDSRMINHTLRGATRARQPEPRARTLDPIIQAWMTYRYIIRGAFIHGGFN